MIFHSKHHDIRRKVLSGIFFIARIFEEKVFSINYQIISLACLIWLMYIRILNSFWKKTTSHFSIVYLLLVQQNIEVGKNIDSPFHNVFFFFLVLINFKLPTYNTFFNFEVWTTNNKVDSILIINMIFISYWFNMIFSILSQ